MTTDPQTTIPRVRFGLGLKLNVGLILIIGVIFASVNTYNIMANRKARRITALNHSATIARLVAGAILDELGQSKSLNSPRLKSIVNTFLQFGLIQNRKNKDLAYAIVIDAQNKLVAGRAKPSLTILPGNQREKNEVALLDKIAALEGNLGGDMRRTRFPLQVGKQRLGKIIIGTSLVHLNRQIRRDLLINGAILAITLVLLILYSWLMLSRLVTKPLAQVSNAMVAVHEGNLDHTIAMQRSDEIGVLAKTYNFMVKGLREREHLKDAFSRYVSKKVYEKFQTGTITLTGEMKNATILFSDIRSFTSLSEQLTPAQVVEMLNEYFSDMVDIVFKYDGFLNKFIGDALMAIYNVPMDQDHPELRAVRTGVEMIQALAALNKRREARGAFPVRVGIGINTGPVIAGNIGHQQRLEYTVIGDAVNLAQRIESQTKVAGYSLLISQSTFDKVSAYIEAEELPPVKVKGKAAPIKLFAVKRLLSP